MGRARATFTILSDRPRKALLDAWDDPTNHERGKIGALDGRFAALRATLVARTVSSRQQKDTKQAKVLAMLSREEGASRPTIAEATGWALTPFAASWPA